MNPPFQEVNSDTRLPNNEHTTQNTSPESNPYVNPVKQLSATSPGNKCDVKYYRSTSTAVPYEDCLLYTSRCV